jgi:hypothetical protein
VSIKIRDEIQREHIGLIDMNNDTYAGEQQTIDRDLVVVGMNDAIQHFHVIVEIMLDEHM